MSDISTPTAPAEPSVPTQVTIPETGPQSPTGEVGQQTPAKSLEQIAIERAAERRGSIERALAKSQTLQAEKGGEDKGKPDQGKPVARSQEKSEQPTQKQPPTRGERGRFASTQPVGTAQPDTTGQPAATPSRYAPLAENAPYREAPPRFDSAAKADWAGVPESVRGAVYQAHQQMERGIQQYRALAQEFAPLQEYHRMARQQGSNLGEVMANYTGMERMLRSDPIAGLDLLISNLELPTNNGQKATLRDIAYHVLNLSPEQHRLTQQQNYARAQAMQIAQQQQQIQHLANNQQQMHYHHQFKATMSEIDRFAASHPRFDEVSGHIKRELDFGFPLPVAYNRAIALAGPGNGSANGNGATHAAQTRNASAQTREDIDRSISGAPNGSAQTSPRQQKSASNREALTKAMRRVRAGV